MVRPAGASTSRGVNKQGNLEVASTFFSLRITEQRASCRNYQIKPPANGCTRHAARS